MKRNFSTIHDHKAFERKFNMLWSILSFLWMVTVVLIFATFGLIIYGGYQAICYPKETGERIGQFVESIKDGFSQATE